MKNIYTLLYRLASLCRHNEISNLAFQKSKETLFELDWKNFADKMLLLYGTMLTLSGIICFFAFNWQDLHIAAKFALLQTGIIVTFLGYLFSYKKKSNVAVSSLASSSILVGVFMAVFGQYYQTGADAYTLFVTWSALILPWAIIAKSRVIWFIELTVGYIGFMLYADLVNLTDQTLGLINILFFTALLSIVSAMQKRKPEVLSFYKLEYKLLLVIFAVLCFINIDFLHEGSRNRFDHVDLVSMILLTAVSVQGFLEKQNTTIFATACIKLGIILLAVISHSNVILAIPVLFVSIYMLTKLRKFLNRREENAL